MSRARAAFPLLAFMCACGRGSEPGGAEPPVPENSTSWPVGTVIAVNDVTIRAADVSPWTDAVALLYPEYTPINCRRLALTNVILPAAGRGYEACKVPAFAASDPGRPRPTTPGGTAI